VAGDSIYYIPENETVPVPQMVENAEASAECVAHNLMADALGVGTPEKYKPSFHGVMVCVGGRYGSAHVGLPGRFFGLASFFAMFAKHFINLIYFIKVLGWNKVASYLNHEFFTIKHRRSFLGGHFSNQSATFFLVPLRMYLGFTWIYEGAKKIKEGWLAGPQLTGYFNGANQFYENILAAANGIAVSAATSVGAAGADAATSATGSATGATGATEAVSGVLLDLNLLGLARALLVQGSEIAFKLQIGLMDWFLDAFVMRSSPMQNFMQYFIVLSEILIGLALLGGLFTTLSGAYSLTLQFMFLTTTGIYMSTWWMLVAGLAVMFGAGRVFSLDYYVMPLLKRYWKRVGFARKWYLYNE
jgi:NADH dehydrogenase